MLFLHETHKVKGKLEDEFEAAIRDEWMRRLAEGDEARLLWYANHAHGSGASYQVVTITGVADGAWEGLARELLQVAAPLLPALGPRVVHQDPANGSRRNGEEVCPVLPFHPCLVDQLDVRLVNESRRLQGVVRPLGGETASREATQLVIHQWVETLHRMTGLVITQFDEESSDVS